MVREFMSGIIIHEDADLMAPKDPIEAAYQQRKADWRAGFVAGFLAAILGGIALGVLAGSWLAQ